VIRYISVGVRTDMQVEQKSLAVFDEAVGILEIGLAFADGFDLSAAEGDAGFEFIGQEVVVAGHAVVGSIPLAAGDGVARAHRLLGAGVGVLGDDMAGLAGHLGESSKFYGSTGDGFVPPAMIADCTAPTGLKARHWPLFPTLKRGADKRCAYGAVGIRNSVVNNAMEIRTGVVNKMDSYHCLEADVAFPLVTAGLC